jgi:YD repeat-containing protein
LYLPFLLRFQGAKNYCYIDALVNIYTFGRGIKLLAESNLKNLPETVTVINKNPVTNSSSKVITSYRYNADYLKPETITVDHGTQKIVTQYTYYNNGNLKTTIHPNGMVETSEYDTAYNAYLSKRTLSGIKDAAGSTGPDIVSRYGYNYYGLKEWEMDGRGYVLQYRYDGLNRLIKVYLPDDAETPSTVPAAGQNPAGNPDREYVFDDAANTCTYWNENRKKTLYSFDGLGRLTSVASYNDQTRYSAAAAATKYHYNDIGKIDKVTDPGGNVTQYEYDGLGRVSKVIYPTTTSETESSAKLSYDDTTNTITVQHENGNIVVHKKNWADQLIQVTQQAVYGNDTVTYQWGFQYDSLGNKVKKPIH